MDEDELQEASTSGNDLRLPSPASDEYAYTLKGSVQYLLEHGFRFAPRTLSWHCQTELLDCKKFTCGSALKWKITKKSLDERIETLKREGYATARNGEQLRAIAGNYETEFIEILKGELKDKNKQIDEFQSIIREHNKQFENLNKTIQLSNQTIQQLNRTLALPQVKDVLGAMRADRNGMADGGHVHASHVYDDVESVATSDHPDGTEANIHQNNEMHQPEEEPFQEPT